MSESIEPGKWRCPGVFRPIETEICPACGEEIEFFAGDAKLKCTSCDEVVYRRSSSCLDRCPAKQSSCYRELMAERKS